MPTSLGFLDGRDGKRTREVIEVAGYKFDAAGNHGESGSLKRVCIVGKSVDNCLAIQDVELIFTVVGREEMFLHFLRLLDVFSG